MSATVQGIDQSILEDAQRLLGTATERDTVNAALREVVRRKLVEEFIAIMADRGPDELDQGRADAWQ